MNLTLTLTDQDGNTIRDWALTKNPDLFLALTMLASVPAADRTYIAFVLSSLEAAATLTETKDEAARIAGL